MTKHTAEPWRVEAPYRIGHDAGLLPIVAGNCGVAMVSDPLYHSKEANAARIVACVNAMAGIEDPASTLEMAREAIRKILRHIPADAGGASLSADVDLCKRAIAILSGKA